MRSTTNPVGPGLAWVKKRFIRNGNFQIEPYKTYWFIDDPGADSPEQNPMGLPVEPGTKFAVDRAFIPGYLEENLGIEDKDAYRARIMQMGKKYARALLQRDWDAFTGDFFDDFSEKLKIDPFMIPREWRLFGSLDPGWSKPCSFGLTSIDSNGGMWRLFTYYVSGQSPTAHAREIRERIAGFYYTGGRMPEYIVAGHDAFGAEKNTMTGENRTWYDIFAQQGLYLIKANTSRVPGWWAVNDAMRNLKLHFFKGYNAPLFDEITSAQHDEKDSEDIMGRGNDQSVPDHALDEMRYGVMSAYKPSKPIVEVQQMLPHWGIEPLSMRLYKDDPRNIWLPDDN